MMKWSVLIWASLSGGCVSHCGISFLGDCTRMPWLARMWSLCSDLWPLYLLACAAMSGETHGQMDIKTEHIKGIINIEMGLLPTRGVARVAMGGMLVTMAVCPPLAPRVAPRPIHPIITSKQETCRQTVVVRFCDRNCVCMWYLTYWGLECKICHLTICILSYKSNEFDTAHCRIWSSEI